MASESIGFLYPTEIPGYTDSADIQVAFRLYHYGSTSYDPANEDPAELVNPSIAYTLNDLQDQIDGLDPSGGVSKSMIDAVGDLIVGNAPDDVARLPVGSNNFILTADSTQTLGVKWAAPAVSETNTVTLTNKTLTAPVITSPSISGTSTVAQMLESSTFSAIAATGTINYNVLTNGAVTYYTSDASGDWTLNIRGNSTTTLNSIMSVGQSLTLVFLVTNGGTPYYQTGLQIDGFAIAPEWQYGAAPTAGNANSIDAYSITIFKTGNAAFTVLETLTPFS
jgi:hypothetical protein